MVVMPGRGLRRRGLPFRRGLLFVVLMNMMMQVLMTPPLLLFHFSFFTNTRRRGLDRLDFCLNPLGLCR